MDCFAHGLGDTELERGQGIDSWELHPNCAEAAGFVAVAFLLGENHRRVWKIMAEYLM